MRPRSRLLLAWALLVFGLLVRSFAAGVLPPAEKVVVEPIRIDPNCASVAELQVLPGVGPERAAAIVLERIRAGPFARAEDLLRVHGLGPAVLAAMAPYLEWAGPVTRGDVGPSSPGGRGSMRGEGVSGSLRAR